MRFFRARKVASSKLIRISLLPHTILPEIEISALTVNLLEVQNDLEACDRAIDRLEATLADLRQHRSSLEMTATHVKSICAPIRSEIAAYTLPPRWHVWTFMQVCHNWRAAALALTWPWTFIHLSYRYRSLWNDGVPTCDIPMDILATYLRRSKQALVVLKKLNTEHLSTNNARDILLRHAYHIRALEVLVDYGQEDLVPCHLPLLQELIFRGLNTGRELDVPNLRILDADSAAPFLNIPWAHLRAVKIQAVKIDDCTNVEVLSFSIGFRPDPPKPHLPHSSSIPALHTLEIGGAAIELCPLIVAPSLRHFTLNMAYNNELWEPGLTLYDASCDTIALRNMHAHSVVHLRSLRKVSFVQESGGGTLGTPYCMNSDFSDPTLSTGAHLARWTNQDIDLVCELFRTRAIPSSTSGCPGLKRVLIRAPYAHPALERLLKRIGTAAESILSVEQGDPVAPFQVTELLRR
ncbi:hypothetical protein EV714DRAFT_280866 [Schizophyllum commune]